MLKWENIQDGILLHEMYIKDTNRLLLRHAIMDNTKAFELLEQCGPFPAQSVWTCITFCGMWWFMNITREKFKKAQGASEQPDVIEYLTISGTCISAMIICCLPWEERKDPCHWRKGRTLSENENGPHQLAWEDWRRLQKIIQCRGWTCTKHHRYPLLTHGIEDWQLYTQMQTLPDSDCEKNSKISRETWTAP